jgi:CMP/dCMP kinase
MKKERITITIDGPSGTGKSTVAQLLAELLGIAYFDTGALYRAISWKILDQKISLKEREKIKLLLSQFKIDFKERGKKRCYFVDGVDITDEIRMGKVTAIVSEVSAMPEVREKLKPLQKDFAEEHSAVFEGRDLGTVVFPEAQLKFFLTARPEVRARRRFDQLKEKFPELSSQLSLEKILSDIEERDRFDSTREIAPLQRAKDAIEIDTSDLSAEEVALLMKSYYEAKKK